MLLLTLGQCWAIDESNSDAVLELNKNKASATSAEQQASAEVFFKLGESYLKASSGSRSYPLIIQNFQHAADLGHVKAQEKLAWLNSYLPNELSLEKRYRRELQTAKTDNAAAQFLVGEMCEFGLGVERNIERAIFWYKKSAEQNYGMAQNRLGELYTNGTIKEESANDAKQAFLWIESAANNGQAQAQFKLASYYALGFEDIVAVNKETAFYWYQKSAENGHIQGQMQTANMLKIGDGVKQNYEQALAWYEKALAQDYEPAREQVREVNTLLDDIFLKNFK